MGWVEWGEWGGVSGVGRVCRWGEWGGVGHASCLRNPLGIAAVRRRMLYSGVRDLGVCSA